MPLNIACLARVWPLLAINGANSLDMAFVVASVIQLILLRCWYFFFGSRWQEAAAPRGFD